MKLLINSSERYIRRVSLVDEKGKEITSIEGDRDLLVLIDEALKKVGLELRDLTSVEAELSGRSRVGISIGAAAANALNYALGLKKLEELKYPNQGPDPFR